MIELDPNPNTAHLLWGVYAEEAEPVDHVEDEEEAGEEAEEHQVHPGRPHLLILHVLAQANLTRTKKNSPLASFAFFSSPGPGQRGCH